ncbi:MAG: hypothetical protein Q9183_003511, partial [Haloplaca sp. 2 TL-2023]
MSSSIDIVQGVENDLEAGEPVDIELRVLDVTMIGLKLDVRIEFGGALFCDLREIKR